MTPTIELSSDFQEKALNTANNFLNSPEAVSIKAPEYYSSHTENQTISKTLDQISNTAFHVESSFVAGSTDLDAKKIVISWHTLGEEKGDLPSGSIQILESGGEKKILAYKHGHTLFTDEGYLRGGSRDMIDRSSSMETGDNRIPLSEEQAFQILARLESSQANKEQTEATAKIMDSENRFSEALVEFQSAQSSRGFNRLLKYGPARKKLVDAAIRYKEVEEEIIEDPKRKKELEQAQEAQDQQKDDK